MYCKINPLFSTGFAGRGRSRCTHFYEFVLRDNDAVLRENCPVVNLGPQSVVLFLQTTYVTVEQRGPLLLWVDLALPTLPFSNISHFLVALDKLAVFLKI